MCDDIFKYSDGFKGACGSIFEILNKSKAEEIIRLVAQGDYGYDDLWRECVHAGNTTEGLTEWLENLVYDEVTIGDNDFVGQDKSYFCQLKQELKRLYESMPEEKL